MKQLIVLLIVLMSIGIVSAATEKTMFTETTCDKERTCNLVIHLTPQRVYDAGEWKEAVQVNMTNGTWVIYTEIDEKTMLTVDYCTDKGCHVCRSVTETGIYPVYKNGMLASDTLYEKGDNSCNIETADKLHFGLDSTEIILRQADATSDSYCYDVGGDDDADACYVTGFMRIGESGANNRIVKGFVQFNLSIVPDGSTIDEALLANFISGIDNNPTNVSIDYVVNASSALDLTSLAVMDPYFPYTVFIDEEIAILDNTTGWTNRSITSTLQDWVDDTVNDWHTLKYYWDTSETDNGDIDQTRIDTSPDAEEVLLFITYTEGVADSPPTVTLVTPEDAITNTTGYEIFNCTATDDLNLVNISTYFNVSGSWAANWTNATTGTWNQSGNNISFLDTTVLWNCLACDNATTTQCAFDAANRTLQITAADVTAPSVIFDDQVPTDITTNNIMAVTANITYNITDETELNLSTVHLEYNVTNNGGFAHIFTNGTAADLVNLNLNYTGNDTLTFNWTLDDGKIYPATYPIDKDTLEDNPHILSSLSTTSAYMKTRIFNISNTMQASFLEIMVNTSGALVGRIYYCNESYTTGNVVLSPFCTNFFNIEPDAAYNHTHSGGWSSHHVIPFGINTTDGTIGDVEVTNTSYFLIRGWTGSDAWNSWYVSNISRADTTQTTNNGGTTWVNLAGTADVHIHQFNGTDTLWYRACANDTSGNQNCSSYNFDNLNITNLPPSAPDVFQPVTGFYRNNISINYTESLSATGQIISYYNITLVNTTLDLVQNIKNNSLELGYSWNTSEASDGNYIIRVEAVDNESLSSFGFSANITIDNTFPQVNITDPIVNGTEVINKTYIFWNSTSDEDIGNCVIEINGSNSSGTIVSGDPYYCFHNQTGLTSNNTYQAFFWISDVAGNINSTNMISRNIDYQPTPPDTTPPNVNMTNPTVNGTEPINKTYIEWNSTSDEDIGQCQLEINGSNTSGTITNDTTSSYCFHNQTGLTANNSYQSFFWIADEAGNMNVTVMRIRTINYQPTPVAAPVINVCRNELIFILQGWDILIAFRPVC